MRILAGLTQKLILAASLMMNPINGITQGVQENCDELLGSAYGKVSFPNWRPTKEEKCFLIGKFLDKGTPRNPLRFVGHGNFTDKDGNKYGYILAIIGDGISDMHYYDSENLYLHKLDSKTIYDARIEIKKKKLSGTKSEE